MQLGKQNPSACAGSINICRYSDDRVGGRRGEAIDVPGRAAVGGVCQKNRNRLRLGRSSDSETGGM